jgi:hypothetical protein
MLDGRLHSIEHARLLIGASPAFAKRPIERVRILGAILYPRDALSERNHARTPSFASDQRLDHGADFPHFLKNCGGNTRRLYGDDECHGSNTCINRVDSNVLGPAVIGQHEVRSFQAVD